MTSAISDGRRAARDGQGRRRARQRAKRTRRVEFSLTGEEYGLLEAAARRAGRARGAYIGRGGAGRRATAGPWRPGVAPAGAVELMRAAGLVRRIGVNLNQAVAKLNATGQPSGDLPGYAAESLRRADAWTRWRTRSGRPVRGRPSGWKDSAARWPVAVTG